MKGIEFDLVWFDQHVSEYKVTASNGPFRGTAKMFVAPDGLSNAAITLSGFPADAVDTREIELGTLDPHFAGGGIRMDFRCVDSVGHASILVTLRPGESRAPQEPLSVCLYIPVEAGAIDAFVSQAQSMPRAVGAKAYLPMADHNSQWVKYKFPIIAEQ
jgi:hypothetical protein